MINNELWKKCAEFHGHECPGLAIGYRASLYAAELLGVEPSPGSGVSCVAGTDKCPVDAVRFILGCTELPIVADTLPQAGPFVDPTAELAKAAIRFCGYRVKE